MSVCWFRGWFMWWLNGCIVFGVCSTNCVEKVMPLSHSVTEVHVTKTCEQPPKISYLFGICYMFYKWLTLPIQDKVDVFVLLRSNRTNTTQTRPVQEIVTAMTVSKMNYLSRVCNVCGTISGQNRWLFAELRLSKHKKYKFEIPCQPSLDRNGLNFFIEVINECLTPNSKNNATDRGLQP